MAIARSMSDALVHRGPDDNGYWTNENGLHLAHRRLAIQDISALGHQPMHSSCGRYTVVFNGEIYNFLSLRQLLELEGYGFNGHSDTEVLLSAISCWGIEGALQRFNGMFAIALWDSTDQTLILARDRIGKKPLYYGWIDGALVFASELKALTVFPGFAPDIDPAALSLYLYHNYVPAPHSIYRDIHKLIPGSYVAIDAGALQQRQLPSSQHFWRALDVAKQCIDQPFSGSFEQAESRLDGALGEAVERRMIADVPLGMLLSGGIDSTLVTALAQAGSDQPVNTFSIGFSDEKVSEAAAAKRVAKYLGTAHTELYVDAEMALDAIPELPFINDEPLGDPSQIPTWVVSKLAREHVTVALSGDGGDELFHGYKRYFSSAKVWHSVDRLPSLAKQPLAALLSGLADRSALDTKLGTFASCLRARDIFDVYLARMAKFQDPSRWLAAGVTRDQSAIDTVRKLGVSCPRMSMMLLDFVHYLTDDILVKVDRAGMRESLELRNPLLDYEVVELAWSLPLSYKVHDGKGKRILREVLGKYVPPALTDRPKQGFSPPLRAWLHGPLRGWADTLLDKQRLAREGIFNADAVDTLWQACKRNQNKGLSKVWTILMFQVWYEGNVLSRTG